MTHIPKAPLILDLCGGTGAWSAPYKEAGYEVMVVTYPIDVRDFAKDIQASPLGPVHGILVAPPCTCFTAGANQRWATQDKEGRTANDITIVRACLDIIRLCNPRWWALENPPGRLPRLVPELGTPVLRFQPWWYGDPYTKRTCLWGTFNPALPKTPVEPIRYTHGSWIMRLGGRSKRTKTLRSITPPGFARAFFEVNP